MRSVASRFVQEQGRLAPDYPKFHDSVYATPFSRMQTNSFSMDYECVFAWILYYISQCLCSFHRYYVVPPSLCHI